MTTIQNLLWTFRSVQQRMIMKDNLLKREAGGRKHSLVIKNATVHHEGEYVVSVGEQECDTTVALHFNVACRMHRYINILYK